MIMFFHQIINQTVGTIFDGNKVLGCPIYLRLKVSCGFVSIEWFNNNISKGPTRVNLNLCFFIAWIWRRLNVGLKKGKARSTGDPKLYLTI